MPLFRRMAALFACVLLLIVGAEAHATGFALVAPSITGRAYSTSTLLPSGRVLVVGGEDANGALLASAEIYDPSTNKWTSTAPLITAREHHTAALLPSGKVLVVGGIGANASMLASAEIYDPVANAWGLGGVLTEGRAYHTMTQLPSGKVLVAGGQTGLSPETKSAELYDPSTNSWSAAANLKISRTSHVAALLPSGKVMVMGGYTDYYPPGGSPYLKSVELYDPQSDTWTDRAPLLTGRRFSTATVLASGRVMVAGGYSSVGFEAHVETYDPASDAWSSIASLGTARMSFTATLLPSGKLMVIGGAGAAGAVGTSEIYDPTAGTWTGFANLLPGRYAHTATLLASGQVLVATGAMAGGVAVGAERYDSGGDGWALTAALNAARSTHTATRLVSGKVLVTGGSATVPLASAEIYDPAASSFTFVASLSAARTGQTATLLLSGKVLVVGGMGINNTYLPSAELFNPGNNSWQVVAPLNTPRALHTATLLPSGKVLVVAGINSGGYLKSAEIYDPVADTWVAAGSLLNTRILHSATLLRTGKVLVAGGSNGVAVSDADLFDPASGTWQPTGPLAKARYAHTATLLHSGKVLTAGGTSNGGLATTYETYDPSTGTWSTTSPLLTPRTSHTATLLASGEILVAGGNDSLSMPLGSTERYDPMTNASMPAANLVTARAYQGATFLPSGKVLIEGGVGSGNGTLLSAELYDPGLAFVDSRRPVITATNNPTPQGTPLIFTGTGLTGDTEGTGGNSNQASPTNYPLVQMRRLDNDQVFWTQPDPSLTSWQGSYQTQALNGLPLGQYAVTAFVNAIPSVPKMLLLTGPASNIAIAHGSPQSAAVNSPFLPMLARVVDSANDPVWGATVTFAPPANGASATCAPASAATDASGLAQTTCTANGMLGSYSVAASAAGVAVPASFALTNVAGPPASIVMSAGSPQSTTVTSVFAQALKTKVVDSGNNPVAGAAVMFIAPGSGASATCLPASPVLTDATGLAMVTCTANATAGSYAVNASAESLPPAVFNLTNLPGAATAITIVSGGGQSTAIDTPFSQPLGVSVVDSLNNGIANIPVTFVVPPSGASAACPAVTTDASGHAQTTCTANATMGIYTVKASAGAMSSPAVPLTNLAGAAASIAAVAGSAQSTVVNTAFAQALKAKVVDGGNNPIAGAAVTFAVPGSGASATCLPANPVLTDANGLAAVTCTANTIAGGYTVAASTGALPSVQFAVTNVPGAAAAIAITSGGGQSTSINTPFSQPLGVSVVDSFNNGIGNIPVSFVVPPNGASAACPAATTDANGHASTTCAANGTMGSYAVKGSTGALTSSAVSLNNLAGAAASIVIVAGSGQATVVNTAFAQTLKAKVVDSGSNPVAGSPVIFTTPANGAGASCIPSNPVLTDVSGLAGVTCTANTIAGGYAIDAHTGALPAVQFGLTNVPGAAAAIAINSGGGQSTSVNAAFAQPLTVSVVDAFGNSVGSIPIGFVVPANGASSACPPATTDASGHAQTTCTANAVAGSYAVKAGTGALTSSPVTLTNLAGSAAAITVQSGSPQSTMVGTMFGTDLQAKVTDALNNPVSGASVLFTGPPSGASATCSPIGAITGANGVATSTCTANAIAGSYTLSASTSGVPLPAAFNLTNLAGMAATITIQAGSPQSTTVNTAFAQALKAKVVDGGNNPVAGAPVTFTAPMNGAGALCVPSNPVSTDAAGVATVTCTANTIAGGYAVNASTGVLPSVPFGLTNVPGAAAAIAITSGGGQSTPVSAAFPQPLAISVVDAFDNGVGNAPVALVVPQNGASALCPSATTDVAGNAQSTCSANASAGIYAVKAASGGLTSSAVSLTNLAGVAATITVAGGSPQSTEVNTAFAQPLKVKVVDSGNNPVAGAPVMFMAPTNGARAVCVPSSPVLTDAVGIAMVSCTANTTAGSYAVDASTGALPSVQFALTNLAGATAAITITNGGGQSAPVNTAFPQALTVSAVDSFNNGVGNTSITFVVPLAGASAVCPTATTDTNGHAQTTCTANGVMGTYATAASTGALSSSPVSLTNLAGPASSLSYATQPSDAVAGVSIAPPIVVHVQDVGGNPVAGDSVTLTLATNPGGSALTGGDSTMTNANGDATFASVSLDRVGTGYALEATDSSANPLTTTSNPFDIGAGPAATISVLAGSPQSTIVSTVFGTDLRAKVVDALNNPISGASVLFAGPTLGASATCSPISATTDADGIAQTSCTANDNPGTYVVNASYESLTPAAFDLTNLGPLTVVCTLPTQVEVVGDSVHLDLVPLFSGPGQTLTYDAIGLPPSLTVDNVNGLVSGILDQNDVAGSPYAVTLRATGEIGSVDEHVIFEVLDPADLLFRSGFEVPANPEPCQ